MEKIVITQKPTKVQVAMEKLDKDIEKMAVERKMQQRIDRFNNLSEVSENGMKYIRIRKNEKDLFKR